MSSRTEEIKICDWCKKEQRIITNPKTIGGGASFDNWYHVNVPSSLSGRADADFCCSKCLYEFCYDHSIKNVEEKQEIEEKNNAWTKLVQSSISEFLEDRKECSGE